MNKTSNVNFKKHKQCRIWLKKPVYIQAETSQSYQIIWTAYMASNLMTNFIVMDSHNSNGITTY